MKSLIILIGSLFSLVVNANVARPDLNFLDCSFGNFNPSYDFIVTRDRAGSLKGKLIHKMSGFYEVTESDYGTDSLELRVNPLRCELRILSKNHNKNSFTMFVKLLRVGHAQWGNTYKGHVAGDLLGAHRMSCEPHQKDLIESLKALCDKHGHIDREISFTKTRDIIKVLETKSSEIKNISGVNIVRKQDYPTYVEEGPGIIHYD